MKSIIKKKDTKRSDLDAEFTKLYLDKVPYKVIGEKLNVSQSKISRMRKRLGIKRERGYTADDLYADEDGVLRYIGTKEKIKTNHDKDGYLKCTLTYKNESVHRIIAEKYIPNPENKPCVNHKNGIKDDNRIENLEWVTYSENEKHSYDVLGKKGQRVPMYGITNGSAKPFVDKETNIVYLSRMDFVYSNNVSKSHVFALMRKYPKRFKNIPRSKIWGE